MRDVASEFQDAAQSRDLAPFLLFRGEFETGEVRLWTGIGTLQYDGEEYTGAGTLLDVSPVEESTEVRATGFTVSLSGVAQESVSLAIDEAGQGKKASIYLGLMDDDGEVISVVRVARGKLDVPAIEEDGESARIEVTYESDLVDLERARETRYTNESQQARFPGDKGFEHVAGLQNKDITWGRPTPS